MNILPPNIFDAIVVSSRQVYNKILINIMVIKNAEEFIKFVENYIMVNGNHIKLKDYQKKFIRLLENEKREG